MSRWQNLASSTALHALLAVVALDLGCSKHDQPSCAERVAAAANHRTGKPLTKPSLDACVKQCGGRDTTDDEIRECLVSQRKEERDDVREQQLDHQVKVADHAVGEQAKLELPKAEADAADLVKQVERAKTAVAAAASDAERAAATAKLTTLQSQLTDAEGLVKQLHDDIANGAP